MPTVSALDFPRQVFVGNDADTKYISAKHFDPPRNTNSGPDKPSGGIWTSSYQGDEDVSVWLFHCCCSGTRETATIYNVDPAARIFQVQSGEDLDFLYETYPHPALSSMNKLMQMAAGVFDVSGATEEEKELLARIDASCQDMEIPILPKELKSVYRPLQFWGMDYEAFSRDFDALNVAHSMARFHPSQYFSRESRFALMTWDIESTVWMRYDVLHFVCDAPTTVRAELSAAQA